MAWELPGTQTRRLTYFLPCENPFGYSTVRSRLSQNQEGAREETLRLSTRSVLSTHGRHAAAVQCGSLTKRGFSVPTKVEQGRHPNRCDPEGVKTFFNSSRGVNRWSQSDRDKDWLIGPCDPSGEQIKSRAGSLPVNLWHCSSTPCQSFSASSARVDANVPPLCHYTQTLDML
jgi:hypothetical protein